MKKKLTKRIESNFWWFDENGMKHQDGTLPKGITGNVSGIYGNVTGISGDVSGISGKVLNVSGNATGIQGNLDDCKISKKDREKGVKIEDLIA
jgi:hypothetical protein